eukprot:COSAG01_NODE_24659_length_771_cov_1.383929_2_plen_165_part_01
MHWPAVGMLLVRRSARSAAQLRVANRRPRRAIAGRGSDGARAAGTERVISEGSARIAVHCDTDSGVPSVFYNNAQIFNRDLSVLVARLLLGQKREEAEAKLAKRVQRWEAARDAGKPMTSKHPAEGACTGARILDALSASGLRAIRYAKELEHLSLVLANDIEAP